MMPVAEVDLEDSWERKEKVHKQNKGTGEVLLFFPVLKCETIIYKSTKLLVQWTATAQWTVWLI